jgi:tRNA pseudouridine38-40 synthase
VSESVKYRLTVAYDGSGYQGWQVQVVGTGVQEILEKALAKLFPSGPRVHSSSRTDTGVHALGMVVHFEVPDAEAKMTPSKLVLAVNAHLPEDVRVLAASHPAKRFHARFDASGKEYRYLLWNHVAHHPLLRKQSWHVKKALDLSAMRAAAKRFVGTHDFRSFRANPDYDTVRTVRTLTAVSIRGSGPLYTVVIRGTGFLYKMCRGIVGTLVQVGEGKIAPDDIREILDGKDRRLAGMTAPAHGLVLRKVFYGKKAPRSDGSEISEDAD